jgi:NitT/TauT family transport system substrate-binding protein
VARLLELGGVDPGTVKILPVSSYAEGVAIIQSGQATAMWATGKAGANLRETKGVRNMADLSTIDSPTVTLLLAREEFLTRNRPLLVRYLKATSEILDFMAGSPERAGEIVNRKTNVPIDQVVANIQREIIRLDFTEETLRALNEINLWGKESGLIKTGYEVIDYVDVQALREAFPDRVDLK